ncbi:inositol monophosphatase 2-like [Microplitis mediator]|uniref:inositol monophosphatase 2-like n=1 Tax=Microplitis mediator TaxID=375433 RepID=UPI0025523D56|nr:inositol monophosphatase 2-like [Microplitis mediator]
MGTNQDIEEYFEFAKQLALQAGEILKNSLDREKVVHIKGNYRDLVTEQDKAIENILISNLSKKYPDHKFIAEESHNKNEPLELTDAPTWIIDPIDGTVNFVHGFSQCCISIGLAINKEIQLGIINNPHHNELFTAKKGQGAFLNDKKISASNIKKLELALINLEPSLLKWGPKRDITLGRIEALSQVADGVRNVGSAVMGLSYVARGIIDAFHMDHLHPWDVAAGCLLVREAGGTVIDSKGGNFNIMKPMTLATGTEALATEISKLINETDLQTQRRRLKRT